MDIKKTGQLFLSFFKIGAFTFGGGYAMIPLIKKEASDNRKWINEEDMLNIIAVAESTPGPIAINAATFIGYKTAGAIGAAGATLGVVMPSFIIISALASVLDKFSHIEAVKYAFFGIRAGVLALIIKAFFMMYGKMPKNLFSYITAVLTLAAAVFFDVNVLLIIALCAASGLGYTAFLTWKTGKGEKR